MNQPGAPRPPGEPDDRPLDEAAGDPVLRDPVLRDPVDRLYRALPDHDAGPAADLDERIRSAARRAVGSRRIDPRPRRVTTPPWWRRLAIPVSIAATALISANLVMMVSEAPDHESPPAAVRSPAPVPPPPMAREAVPVPVPAPADAARGAAAVRPEAGAQKARPPAADGMAAAPSPERRAANSALGRERRTPSERFDPAWQAPTAAERLAAIQAMLDRGDREGARAALKALRTRFPETPIPEPLRPLIGAD